MVGVIVKKDGRIVEKWVMAGDDRANFDLAVKTQAENPDKEFVVYNDSERAEFEAHEVDRRQTPYQAEWTQLQEKASDIEKLFARMLGLE